ncbi:prepilin-type N-terminal cleavage/methylation domain-containing protein [Francisella sp. 19X1-34]|uniref:prepilin-type N-terminal cleavage/methylation domain-containing protein n=1 Tax=Francisella sp. 19X1-34 TaxID=3087177 RepID=UPI002E2F5CCD|nr:prepilin-type N-terminal cleavage/methylation domain-containing protein [Francisella sp. 19X1-34]MED7789239.1 prepilin-type N-terminal cleavage/methylation domain-containing protein [Francisella sp. 19X1-34]
MGRVALSKHQGFTLIELVIAMLVISIAVLSYEIILYRSQGSESLLVNDAELVETADNKFNEFLITGNLDNTVPSGTSVVISSGSTANDWVFTSGRDSTLSINMDLS